jgi:periplasmic divalent cation tolerance protein
VSTKSPKEPPVIVVVTSVGTQEQALDIAHHLVHRRLAACVNIVPGVRSIFRWKGKMNDDTELLLMAKTTPGKFEAVKEAIKEIHSYELPEILGYPAPLGDALFNQWVIDSTTGEVDEDEEAFAKPMVSD